MADDNTPTVTARRRKPTRHMRLRMETVKRLRALGARRKRDETKDDNGNIGTDTGIITTRTARAKKNALKSTPIPPAKFRKRQMNKTWLPTHIYHAKRAHMTPPREPLWRFSIPMTSTAKSYRPTHRASNERGAIAWDMSYMSCISLEGVEQSIQGVLKGLNVGGLGDSTTPWGPKGQRWRNGTRVWQGWLYERDMYPSKPIAPATIIWRAETYPDKDHGPTTTHSGKPQSAKKDRRQAIIRIHPSAFLQLWEQIARLIKVQRPQVVAEDLRFEVGSIEITGPGSTEALIGALWPASADSAVSNKDNMGATFAALAGVTNPAVLPANALLSFDVIDPRLHHPPRTVETLQDDPADIYKILTDWPCDSLTESPGLFDRRRRLAACRALQSQKAINRRKSLAKPGSYPDPLPLDPRIPVLIYPSSRGSGDANTGRGKQATWTVLLPWKAVPPVWQSIMYYPLSTGGQVRLGGLQEKRQVAFENGSPWFPGDYPGTQAGKAWEALESSRRKKEWERRPKGKRVQWGSIALGPGRTGEIGDGCACDWNLFITDSPDPAAAQTPKPEQSQQDDGLYQLPPAVVRSTLATPSVTMPAQPDLGNGLANVRVTLLTRGVPSPCARIYRLPTADASTDIPNQESLLSRWLSLDPAQSQAKSSKKGSRGLPAGYVRGASSATTKQALAADLVQAPSNGDHRPESEYPEVPGQGDLVGFVTTGEFCLTEGKGVAMGSILLRKMLAGAAEVREKRLCIVRNAGETVGRLAKWEVV